MKLKIAVLLSGCGVYDGAEIYESVLTLLRLDQLDVQVQCFAPDQAQHHVINHITGEEMAEQRNVLTEAARICRGAILPLAELKAEDFDALILPGGFGVAKNFSDFAFQGAQVEVDAQVCAQVQAFHQAGKPLGLMCIAPALTAKLLGQGVTCTIGQDAGVAGAISAMGGLHKSCAVDEIVVDAKHKLVTTPAYMLAERIHQAAQGIFKLVDKVVELAKIECQSA